MVKQVNIAEAKTTLSKLLDDASSGEEVIIARSGRPIARLVSVGEPPPRTLGFLPLTVDDDLFAPLDGGELAAWE